VGPRRAPNGPFASKRRCFDVRSPDVWYAGESGDLIGEAEDVAWDLHRFRIAPVPDAGKREAIAPTVEERV